MTVRLLAGWILLALAFAAAPANAHEPFQSYASVRLRASQLEVSLTMSMIAAERLLDPRPTELLSPETFDVQAPRLRAGAAGLFQLTAGTSPLSPQSANVYLTEENDIEFRLVYPRPAGGRLNIVLSYLQKMSDDHHATLAVVDEAGANFGWEELTPDAPGLIVVLPADANFTAGAAAPSIASPASPSPRSFFVRFFVLGVEHILTGYDHLLFLCGLLVVCRKLKTMVTIITCFTVAHSITLALAALGWVAVSGKIVEPLIAASIVYVGLENLWRHGEPRARWLLTAGFGLIHGFGFAGALIASGLGANGTPMLVPLFSFNLGVEAGQLAVAAVFVPLLWQLRKWPPFERRGATIVSGLVALAGAYWLLQRTLFA